MKAANRQISVPFARTLLFGGLLCVGFTVRFATAQTPPDAEEVPAAAPIQHEPVPPKRGLVGAPSETPALLIETSDGATGRPGGPSAGPETSDDIVYRAAGTGDESDSATVQNVRETIRPDRDTGREPWLNYHVVFDPAVIPFKRNSAKDTVLEDGGIVVGATALRPVPLYGNRVGKGREVFSGSILVDFTPNSPIPIPSIAPESNVLSAESTPEGALQFLKDGADNLYVRSSLNGRVRLNYVLDAPSSWFAFTPTAEQRFQDIPDSLRPVLPVTLEADVAVVAKRIGIRARDDFATTLRKLVWWFRSFKPGDLRRDDRDIYLELALSRRGVCRHRAYAFLITAHGLGIPARYVSNEAHVFVEVYAPGAGWLRIDLGGGAQGMNVRGASDVGLHGSEHADPWGYPQGFRSGYSQQANHGPSVGGVPVTGLPVGRSVSHVDASASRSGGASRSAFERPAATNRRLKPSRTILTSTAASVFRGEAFLAKGRVITESGSPIVDGVVRIQLMDMTKSTVVLTLGHIRTDSEGYFQSRVTIPKRVEPGSWQLIAEFLGDGIYGSSQSD